MFYNFVRTPAIVKTGMGILGKIDDLLHTSHLHFPQKVLITQKHLYDIYRESLLRNEFCDIIFVEGGNTEEAAGIISQIKENDGLLIAFGGGSVLDLVKYCADKADKPYINIPSALSNDAVYSCVARLTRNGKKYSFGVQPPIGLIVDFDVVRHSPATLLYAGVADLVSNLSALQDWKLAHKNIHESINEIAYMLSKQSVIPLFRYKESDLLTEDFLFDLTNGLITSGLSMIICGSTRVTSGAEHLISHAIDEYFHYRSSIHGLQVGWAHEIINRKYRTGANDDYDITEYFNRMGGLKVIHNNLDWEESEFDSLIPYAKKIRNRYTIFNTIMEK